MSSSSGGSGGSALRWRRSDAGDEAWEAGGLPVMWRISPRALETVLWMQVDQRSSCSLLSGPMFVPLRMEVAFGAADAVGAGEAATAAAEAAGGAVFEVDADLVVFRMVVNFDTWYVSAISTPPIASTTRIHRNTFIIDST